MKDLLINKNASILFALRKLKKCGEKCLVVVDKNKVIGTLSDGDLRKKIIVTGNVKGKILKYFNSNPIIISEKELSKNKKKLMIFLLKKN